MPFNLPLTRQRSPRYEPLRPDDSPYFDDDSSDRAFSDFGVDTPKTEDFPDLADRSSPWTIAHYIPALRGYQLAHVYRYGSMATPRRPRRTLVRGLLWAFILLPYIIVMLVTTTMILRPSYTHAPAHYQELRERATTSLAPGRGNINNEKVFIASAVYDDKGSLLGGPWGKALLDLVDLLGPENVHLSVYENDPDDEAKAALEDFKNHASCNSTIVHEHLPLDEVRRVTLPNGEKRIKRIAYLAEVRNRAMRPLDTTDVKFDKILFLNDVYFDPVDAAQLLFSTNLGPDGRTNYRAACAVDFANPFKFYDTFASRDLEGHSMGLPFFPWFPDAGYADTRNDILEQLDAVRVRSCWGGMVSYEAKWFQSPPDLLSADPVSGTAFGVALAAGHLESQIPISLENNETHSAMRFRFEDRTFWDASECCLINADLQRPRDPADPHAPSGIYLNPFIRTAYDERTLSWLWISRRPERLYSPIHNILTRVLGLPGENPRRMQEPGSEIVEHVWEYNQPFEEGKDMTGQWRSVKSIAGPGSYCGSRKLLVLGEKEGESRWMRLPTPPELP
ncbi:cryptococcal mannosyltransferase 1-domain-containing protein [Phyllosticta citribraziliensis]|uniref:Cryptococcal mannosyltransferase 1-domain-containing protein n=1 Tax=Phyllosticta citribraziliensis TaxID=989973 RepID=A0ABR1L4W6_9PEZI